jgi:phosphate transport system permease protein
MSEQHDQTPPGKSTRIETASSVGDPRHALTRRQRRIGERLAELGIFAVATVSIVAILLIFIFIFKEAAPIFFGPDRPVPAVAATANPNIVREGYPVLQHDSPVKPSYLWYDAWQPNSEHPAYGIIPIIIGTIKTTLVSLLIATPLGILAALYTAFFAPHWVREYLKPVIELLAAFPSVVVGFFCLMTVASFVQSIFGNAVRLNAVVGGIGLSIAVVPIIYTITDDALRAVPRSLREAALALGASEWQAAYQVLLPAATPGIVAAVLLGLGRAFGETMIALMATGNGQAMSWDFFVSVRTFAATIGAEMGEVVSGSPHYQVLFFLGVLLFIFSFTINFVTEFYVKQRLIKRFRGSE